MNVQKTRKELAIDILKGGQDAQLTAEVIARKIEQMSDDDWERWGKELSHEIDDSLEKAISTMNAAIVQTDVLKNIRDLTKDPFKG